MWVALYFLCLSRRSANKKRCCSLSFFSFNINIKAVLIQWFIWISTKISNFILIIDLVEHVHCVHVFKFSSSNSNIRDSSLALSLSLTLSLCSRLLLQMYIIKNTFFHFHVYMQLLIVHLWVSLAWYGFLAYNGSLLLCKQLLHVHVVVLERTLTWPHDVPNVDSDYTGWPRKNATLMITNFKEIRD